ncbi:MULTISPECIES: BTAD domain-containing putative transcriptional regulator [Pseudonocardia]|uniref:Transcriptional regulator n=1 Tax=Pseudonocardia abyssalis TaxID=2792008 RepID=A0ABS6V2D2_9PSEU|nr:BTAD domain-containing putative transcriptional regulator [Pseudonocardia abyssalis]MBW0113946.1 transcriptional regulator [Pseudonocardia abyssalis]MBW0138431.1 transcriptional regulator [Pseudonocardia abyssalis]
MIRGASAAVLLAVLVAGVPWALARYVGWPLPERLPTGTELELHLFGPLSSGLLLDILACACWLAWAAFTLDVVRCTAALLTRGTGYVRVPSRVRLSPTHALAAVLVGAVVLSILGNRLPLRDARSAAVAWPVALTAGPARPEAGPLMPVAFTVPDRTSTEHTDAAHTGKDAEPESAHSVVVRVPDPVTGVHDSLWRIADRTLGSGARWPEIFEINRGKPQPGGGTFTRPSLIFPGEELVLPPGEVDGLPDERPPAGPDVPPTTPTPTQEPMQPLPTGPSIPGPSIPETGSPVRPPAGGDEHADTRGGAPALIWDPVAFAGLGLAAAVSAALMAARRRHRRRYRPGSGRRDDLPAAPVVYQLRLAHLRADQPDPDEPDPEGDPGPDDDPDPGRDEDDQLASTDTRSGPATPAAGGATPGEDAQRIALAAAGTRGLGLAGPGAPDALRALLLTLIAGVLDGAVDQRPDLDEGGPVVRLLVPREDSIGVLGSTGDLPSGIEVHDTLDGALDVLESESVARAAHPPTDHTMPVLVLVARIAGDNARLQAVLDNGSDFGISALLLGQWRSGSTVHVRRDGTVTATGPGPCAALRGTRLLTLDRDAAVRIVELFHDTASGTAAPDRSAIGAKVADSLEIGPPSIEERNDPPSSTEHAPLRAPAHVARSTDEPTFGVLPLRLVVLGPPRLHWRPRRDPDSSDPAGYGSHEVEAEVEITGRLQPRARELLVHLALHPDGVGRESVAAALWPGSSPGRTTNSLNTALTRLRQTLTQVTGEEVGDIVRNSDGRFCLDPDLVDVDYWRFDAAVTARRAAGTDEERIDADQLVVETYGGELAEGTPYPWIEIAREAVRRDAIDSAAALARALVPRDPQRTLDLLEIARAFDPINEMIYRDIMRLQSRLGRLDAISRTLALLTARLGEIGDQPDADTIDLARRLQSRGAAEQHVPRGADDSGSVPPGGTARAG